MKRAVLAVAALCSAALCRGAEPPAAARDPFEPTVTAREAELLGAAAAAGSTNAAAGMAILLGVDREAASPALDFALGNVHYQAGELDLARGCYESALRKMPTFRAALANLGRIHLLQDRPADAIRLYRGLLADGQADSAILVLLGHALLLERQPVSAEGAYRQALLLGQRGDEAAAGLAKCLLEQERYAEASSMLGELLERDPGNREFWFLRAAACLAQHKDREALLALESVRRLGCADAERLCTLADLYLNAEQPEDAAVRYVEAIEAGPPPAARLLRAAEAFVKAGDAARAKDLMARIEGLQLPTPLALSLSEGRTLLRLRGALAYREGNSDAAVAAYARLLEGDPLDAETLILLGEIHREQGRLEDAAMCFERAARIPGREADALVRQAQTEVDRARYAKAVELLEAALAFGDRPQVSRYLEQVRRLAP